MKDIDPAVTLALITAAVAVFASIVNIVSMQLSFYNQQRLAEQNRRWDVEDRKTIHETTMRGIEEVKAQTTESIAVGNHNVEKFAEVQRDIQSVLALTETKKDKEPTG